jgi:hypothetical protein
VVPPATPTELARRLADAFEDASLPYAIGGAIALGFYVPPRATLDVDVNVFVSPRDDFAAAHRALRAVGFTSEAPVAELQAQVEREGQFRGYALVGAGDERLDALEEIERDVRS